MPSVPCVLLSQGRCAYGDECRFSHVQGTAPPGDVRAPAARLESTITPAQSPNPRIKSSVPAGGSRGSRASRRAGAKPPCKAWTETGTCASGSKCRFRHDPEVLATRRVQEQEASHARAAAEKKEQPPAQGGRELEEHEERLRSAEERVQALIETHRQTLREAEAARLARDEEQRVTAEKQRCAQQKRSTRRDRQHHSQHERAALQERERREREEQRLAEEQAQARVEEQYRRAALQERERREREEQRLAEEQEQARVEEQYRRAALQERERREREKQRLAEEQEQARVEERRRMALEQAEAARLAREEEQKVVAKKQRCAQQKREARREQQRRIQQEREAERERERLAEERRQAQIEEQQRMAREQEEAARLAREEEQRIRDAEAAKALTIQRVVQGSIVTFGAGLEIRNIITGFESCVVTIQNLPLDAREHEISDLFLQQGIAFDRFQIMKLRRLNDKQEAQVAIDVEHGAAVVAGLDEIEFRDETLTLKLGPYNTPGGMGSCSSSKNLSTLTVSWLAPSARNVVAAARRQEHRDSVDSPSYTDDLVVDHLHRRINSILPLSLLSFTRKHPTQPHQAFSVDATFHSPEQAHRVRKALARSDLPCIGKSFKMHLPEPMRYILTIPKEQYQAQRAQWTELLGSVKAVEGCRMFLREEKRVVRIHVVGSIEQAVGEVKMRVERLASGERVPGWHRSLGFSKNLFVQGFFDETGVHLRADWRTQTLKIYGDATALEGARPHIARELERLAGAEVTRYLKRESLRFFVQRGIAELKERFGDDAVISLNAQARKITVSAREDVRHALDTLVVESLRHQTSHATVRTSIASGQACTICDDDDMAAPHTLACGHVYCTPCIQNLLTSAFDSDPFAIRCAGNENQCLASLPIPTLQRFLSDDRFNHLLEIAFHFHVRTHAAEFVNCKTPDCIHIFRRSLPPSPTTTLQCPSCFSTVCSSCAEDAHDGITCEQHRINRNPAELERLNVAWMREMGGTVKKCPSCKVFIEKVAGCNHIFCRCGTHICWQCMSVFNTSRDTYVHMRASHASIDDEHPPGPLANVDIHQQNELLREVELRRQRELAAAELRQGQGQRRALAAMARRKEERQRELKEAARRNQEERRQEADRQQQQFRDELRTRREQEVQRETEQAQHELERLELEARRQRELEAMTRKQQQEQQQEQDRLEAMARKQQEERQWEQDRLEAMARKQQEERQREQDRLEAMARKQQEERQQEEERREQQRRDQEARWQGEQALARRELEAETRRQRREQVEAEALRKWEDDRILRDQLRRCQELRELMKQEPTERLGMLAYQPHRRQDAAWRLQRLQDAEEGKIFTSTSILKAVDSLIIVL
ncbi:hypothetical protein HGRIS_002678 [Hohenbuehelia grisea]|uniref:RING-type E3 ubiquitin transferase n=1 Tax=Hohenbuehelia grisea TaxID=104357 RepID=A0ABR3JMF2_9AGAR